MNSVIHTKQCSYTPRKRRVKLVSLSLKLIIKFWN
nr:MAG TPA: hypothetical protein [Caudoviricetes sp.]